MTKQWLTPLAISAVLVGAVVMYFERPTVGHADRTTSPDTALSAPAPDITRSTSLPVSGGSCVAPSSSSLSRDALAEKYRWAHSLIEQKLFDAALPELRELADDDPGYPGINLDISTTLLQLKRPEEARAAIDRQVALSDCLAKLPVPALTAYCKQEFPASRVAACVPRLTQLRQMSQVQSALVHLELGHPGDQDATVAPPVAAVPRAKPARVERSVVAHVDQPAPVARPKRIAVPTVRTSPEARSADRSLIEGAGTDSDLGAYSKPQ